MIANSKQAIAGLVRLSQHLHTAVPAILDPAMIEGARRARNHAPHGKGELADSIQPILTSPGPVYVAGIEADSKHAAAQEFGTAHNLPHPFFRPATRQTQQRLTDSLPQKFRSHLKG